MNLEDENHYEFAGIKQLTSDLIELAESRCTISNAVAALFCAMSRIIEANHVDAQYESYLLDRSIDVYKSIYRQQKDKLD